ncbi:MAG: acetyl-CoA carboxylase biotin carboxyl carrier protein [bacterium]|nr:MAG: acetyl-CoA carboxylase biotin carboxyl carrier protein [bacterium]
MLVTTIKKLIEILKEEDIDEIEVRRLFTTVRVARRRNVTAAASAPALDEIGGEGVLSSLQGAAVSALGDASAPEHSAPAPPREADVELTTVVSPMVGTFYRASSPESEPFVREGKRVEIGEVLCIIEAMKLMNEIEADTNGIIRKVLVADAQPVEYGQPLFLVESA